MIIGVAVNEVYDLRLRLLGLGLDDNDVVVVVVANEVHNFFIPTHFART